MQERSTVPSYAARSSAADSERPFLFCLSHLRWDFVWQRPQHLLSRAAHYYQVQFIEEPLFRPGAAPHMEVARRPEGITVAVPILPEGLDAEEIILEQRELVEDFISRQGSGPRVFWYYTPMAMAFTAHLDCDLCIYDNMDELSLFRGASRELIDLESELFKRADVVFTGGMTLYEAKRRRHGNVHGFPSSIDLDHFSKARAVDTDPDDQAPIARPRLGFFGVVDERMDVDLVCEVASLRPEWQLIMIGPVVKIDPAGLPRLSNIHWLGSKSYKQLPQYLAGWDVGFMPFALNEATRFISPTKTPEFLAAGVPVVSTPITDVVRPYGEKGLVEIAVTPVEVIEKVELLMQRPRAPWLRRVDRHLATGSWDKTWAAMHRLMIEALCTSASSTVSARIYAPTPAE
jgi:glycosyltransferase involved in cell wall biosynthesis